MKRQLFCGVFTILLLLACVALGYDSGAWYKSTPGWHRHVTRDGRIIEHEDWNKGSAYAHRELYWPWWKYNGPRAPSSKLVPDMTPTNKGREVFFPIRK
jgi:hypothetical protein